jgi:putative DNA primase/helicase
LHAAASVWGPGGFVLTWRATANGLEGAAAGATDTALILDELGQVDPREAQAAFYTLANGGGKARAARDGVLRQPKTWRVMILSSGEIPVGAKLAEDRGRRARAGQLVRVLDVPAERLHGVFDHGGWASDAGVLAKEFRRAAATAYGTAGPEFVRRLIAEHDIAMTVRTMVSDFVTAEAPRGSSGQIDRAAQRFGLIAVAGELATALGVTPWREGEARAAAAWAFREWIAGRGGTEPAEMRQAVEQVRLFIEQHGAARFDRCEGSVSHPVHNRAGWRKGEGEECEWLIPSEIWKNEVCAGLDPALVARTLAERGMLRKVGDGWQCVRKIEGANRRVYVVTARILDGGDGGDLFPVGDDVP